MCKSASTKLSLNKRKEYCSEIEQTMNDYKNKKNKFLENIKKIEENIEVQSQKLNEIIATEHSKDIRKMEYNGTLLILRKGDLSKRALFAHLKFLHLAQERSDAIVNTANSNLDHKCRTAKAIAEAAGPEFHEECKAYIEKYNQLGLGKAMTTSAGGSLKCKQVIHTVGPDMRTKEFECNAGKAQGKIRECMLSIINEVNKNNITSISIPAISSGIYKFPVERCAAVMGDVIKTYIDGSDSLKHKEIIMCNNDDKTTDTFSGYFFQAFEKEDKFESEEDSDQ